MAPATAWRELGGIGAQRSSQISTASVTPGSSGSWNRRSVPNGSRLPGEAHLAFPRLARGGEPALLVVLLVAGEERLGHDAQDPARLDDGGRVEQPPPRKDRQADHEDGGPARRPLQHAFESPLGAGHQGGEAEEEVAAGVARQAELGEHDHLRAPVGRPGREVERRVRASLRVGDLHGRTSRRHPQEAKGRCSHGQILTRSRPRYPGAWGVSGSSPAPSWHFSCLDGSSWRLLAAALCERPHFGED